VDIKLSDAFDISKSTYYGIYPGGGACALDPPSPLNSQPGWIMVAAGQYDYHQHHQLAYYTQIGSV